MQLEEGGGFAFCYASWGYLKETVERTLISTFSLIKTFKMWSKEINHTGGNGRWYSHSGKESGSFLQN